MITIIAIILHFIFIAGVMVADVSPHGERIGDGVIIGDLSAGE